MAEKQNNMRSFLCDWIYANF